MSKEHENITHNIAWLRKKNGLTKKQMALLLGISVKSLSKIERGEICRKLNMNTIFDVMCIFDVSADELFNTRFGEE